MQTDEKPSEAAQIEVKKEEDVVEKERPSEGEVKKAPEEKFTAQDEQEPVVSLIYYVVNEFMNRSI